MKYFEKFFLFLILFVILLINVLSVQNKTNTYDEEFHLNFGENVLSRDFSRKRGIDDSKMPISTVNALPKFLTKKYIKNSPFKDFCNTLNAARYMTIIFSLILAYYVFLWSKDLYGKGAGFFSILLYAFSPNIIAHSRLVTTDLYITTFYTIALYYFWKFSQKMSITSATICGIALGLAQLTKYSAIFLYSILFFLLLILFLNSISKKGNSLNPSKLAFYYIYFVLVSILVLNLGFAFDGTFTHLSDYSFRSNLFKQIQSTFSWIGKVPLPYSYLDGLDFVRHREQLATGFGNMYLLGEIRANKGFFGYYFATLFFKLPIATWIAFIFSLIYFFKTSTRENFFRKEIFILFPLLFLLLYFNFLNNSHIGIRFILPVIPLIIIFSSFGLKNVSFKKLAPFLILYLIVSCVSYHPHYISYFNEIVLNRKNAYKYLADSNIDWNQNRNFLNEYLKKNPDAVYNPKNKRFGKIVVSVNALTGVWNYAVRDKNAARSQYAWLRDNFTPSDHIAYSYLVYDINQEEFTGKFGK